MVEKLAAETRKKVFYQRKKQEVLLDSLAICERLMADTNWTLRAIGIMDVAYYLSSYWVTLHGYDVYKLIGALYDPEVEVRKAGAAGFAKVIPLLQESQAEKIIGELSEKLRKEGEQSELELHGTILGLAAFVQAQAVGIPKWTPRILQLLAKFSNGRGTASDSVRVCFSAFWKAHKETWEYEKQKFTEEQRESLLEHVNPYNYFA